MKTHHIIFHRSDWDGIMSAAVLVMQLSLHAAGNSIRLHPFEYGDPVPEIQDNPMDNQILMADINVPELMEYPNLVWIDHHKSAIAKYPGNIPGMRVDGVAACRLCWSYMTDPQREEETEPTAESLVFVDEPEIVQLCGMYDVWDKSDLRAESLNFGLNSLHFDSPEEAVMWTVNFLGRSTEEQAHQIMTHIIAGQAAQGYQRERDIVALQRSYLKSWHGIKFKVLNTALGNSTAFDAIKADDPCEALLVWRFDGTKVIVSLYHRPGHEELDLGAIAARFGGGGHMGAARFVVESMHKWIALFW